MQIYAGHREKILKFLLGEGTIQAKYKRWTDTVMKIKKKMEVTIRKKKNSSNVRQLMRIKRKVKKTEENKRRKLRIHLINEHIRNEIHSKHAKRIQKILNS